MAEQDEALGRSAPVIEPGHTFATVTDKISSIVLTRRAPLFWFVALGASFSLLMLFLWAITHALYNNAYFPNAYFSSLTIFNYLCS
jgi:molybdopterin-containing oxidoreductase family membrane subunit